VLRNLVPHYGRVFGVDRFHYNYLGLRMFTNFFLTQPSSKDLKNANWCLFPFVSTHETSFFYPLAWFFYSRPGAWQDCCGCVNWSASSGVVGTCRADLTLTFYSATPLRGLERYVIMGVSFDLF